MLDACEAPTPWLAEINPADFSLPAAIPSATEVAVIGGGIMGVATTYWLARAGIPVLLIEARGLADGATGRNAGLMLAGARPLEDPRLVQAVLEEEVIAAEYAAPGHLALAGSAEVWEQFCAEAARRREHPTPVFALDHAACEDLLGMRVNPRFPGGRWLPSGGMINPARYVYGLAMAARRRGASFLPHARVMSVERAAGPEGLAIQTNRGRLHARQTVFACNAAVRVFVPQFRAAVTPVRGQVLATHPLPPLFKIGLGVDFGTVYWRQMSTGAIIIGGYRNRDPETETSDREEVNPRVQEALAAFLPEAFPDFPPVRVAQQWAGIMDYPTDGQPLIGALPGAPGQWIISGFGGHGLPGGLGAGKALAEAITTGQVPPVLAPYDPGRLCGEPLVYPAASARV